MRAEFLELVADVFIDVFEGVEEGRGDCRRASTVLDAGTQFFLGGMHQAAIGVIDDHELLGIEKIVGDEEGAEGIVCDDATGVSDDVGVAGLQAEGADGEARVHAGKDGQVPFRARGEFAEFVRAGVDLV